MLRRSRTWLSRLVRCIFVLACAALVAACGNTETTAGNSLVQPPQDAGGGGQIGFDPDSGGAGSGSDGGSEDAGSAADPDSAAAAGSGPKTIQIQITTQLKLVAEPAKVRCLALDKHGVDLQLKTGWELVITKPLSVVSEAAGLGLAVVTNKAGKWPVRCRLVDAQLESDQAAVSYIASDAAKAVAKPEKAEIVAGDAGTLVACELRDAFDNSTTTLKPANTTPAPKPAKTKVDALSDTTVIDGVLRSKKAGIYAVTCGVPGADLEKIAGSVTVRAGAPDFSKAVVTPSSAKVDEQLAVKCTAYDKYGNIVDEQPHPWDLDADAGCTAKSDGTGGSFVCTKTGVKQVRCKHKLIVDAVATLTEIKPGKPVTLKLKLDPDLPNYSHAQKIQLTGTGTDKYGNVVADIALKPIKLAPGGGTVDAVNAQVWFLSDGVYTATAYADSDLKVSDSRKIRVDTNGPLIKVTSPKRAATVLWSSKMTVTFSVADELSGLGSVKINGIKPNVGTGISIKQSVPVKQGMNLIKIAATDEFGNKNTLMQAVYAARQYAKTETKDAGAAKISHGVDAFLGQKALDSGYRNHAKPKDLATVVEIVLKNLDVKALVGQSFDVSVTGYSGTASITNFTFGNNAINKGYPKIKLTATSSGLHLSGTIYNVVSNIYVKGKHIYNPNIKAKATASSMNITGTLGVQVSSSGKATVTTSNITVKLNSLKVTIENKWGFLVNWIIKLFKGSITNLLQNTLKDQISKSLAGPLGEALQAFALQKSLALPGFFGAPAATVKLTSMLQTLTSYGPSGGKVGGLKLGMRAGLTSVRKVPHKILGSIMRRSCLKTYQTYAKMPRKSPFEIAMHLDLANQMFAAIWQAGGLKMKVPTTALGGVDLSKYDVTGLAVDAEFLLPPFVHDCSPGGKPEIQLGDVQLDVKAKLSGQPIVLRVYMSAAAGVKLVAVSGKAGKEIGLEMATPHVLESDVDSVLLAGKPAPVSSQAFFQQLLPLVAGQLIGLFKGTLASFPLPELDLSMLSASIPKGTVLALDIKSVYSKPGNIHADGNVK
jgi:hypothetical protein